MLKFVKKDKYSLRLIVFVDKQILPAGMVLIFCWPPFTVWSSKVHCQHATLTSDSVLLASCAGRKRRNKKLMACMTHVLQPAAADCFKHLLTPSWGIESESTLIWSCLWVSLNFKIDLYQQHDLSVFIRIWKFLHSKKFQATMHAYAPW